ncbi:hypothetical protein HGO97_003310 [Faecalicatena sp. AGMB00832]|uniref:DUF6774 domain-containing protein n=1 Tax=Faecalicatena faecalis TaxID=2726362 RepID=A0ABS6D0T4_9FIRM|nr:MULTISPECIES: DUF6774 domain-containing protein [Faecalicatena]MBU3874842.1 hypothetical protein [Faecalicatena faecalis]MCI6465790.1 hypothetical protein [Faecalicatena sp.]MDY5618794.1 DUF6774 domain-containing protein [Lachnospiraceae bacterium]
MITTNSCELVTYVSSIACVLAKNCRTEDLELLAAIFSQLGDTLATILVNNALCETVAAPDTSTGQ